MMKWLTGEFPNNDILDESKKLRNISFYLDQLKKQGSRSYLRLMDINVEVIKQYLSECSWNLLEDFLRKNKHELNVCHVCKFELLNNNGIFKCSRCLLYYHDECEDRQTLNDSDLSGQYLICKNCYFMAAV